MSRRAALSAVLFVAALSVSGCKKKSPVAAADDVAPTTSTTATTTKPPQPAYTADAFAALAASLRRVHFAYDSYTLDGESRAVLAASARILAEHPEIAVEVTGHCDERGTTDYNLALGQRRAEAVRAALTDAGVSPSRVRTRSLGEESPLETGVGEQVWAQNRRAEFVVLAQ